jgi:hypothetical protein
MPTTAPDGPGVDPVQVGAITFRTTEAPTRIGLGAGKHDVAARSPGGPVRSPAKPFRAWGG